jgi:hypothetical protein
LGAYSIPSETGLLIPSEQALPDHRSSNSCRLPRCASGLVRGLQPELCNVLLKNCPRL